MEGRALLRGGDLHIACSPLTHEDVDEVAVGGRPGWSRGEPVCAVVPAAPRVLPLGDEPVVHCHARLAGWRPRTVVSAAQMPKNATGNVLRHQLCELAVPGASFGDGVSARAGAAPWFRP